MPKFIVRGVGRETERRRRRCIEARDEDDARALAEADGTTVELVERLPDEPPTERQLAYANNLDLSIPVDATKDEVSDLLSAHLDRDKQADSRHFRFADLYGVVYTQYTGKKSIYDRIFAALSSPGREHDLVSWFVYRVYRALVLDREGASVGGPGHPIVQQLAAELVKDDRVLKSIRRYRGSDLISFGEWTAPNGYVYCGASNRTVAYKRSARLLRDALRSELSKAPSRASAGASERTSDAEVQKPPRRAGCASVLALIVSGLVVLGGVFIRLVA